MSRSQLSKNPFHLVVAPLLFSAGVSVLAAPAADPRLFRVSLDNPRSADPITIKAAGLRIVNLFCARRLKVPPRLGSGRIASARKNYEQETITAC